MVKSSTKPDAWTLSPQMTAAPELWRDCGLFLNLLASPVEQNTVGRETINGNVAGTNVGALSNRGIGWEHTGSTNQAEVSSNNNVPTGTDFTWGFLIIPTFNSDSEFRWIASTAQDNVNGIRCLYATSGSGTWRFRNASSGVNTDVTVAHSSGDLIVYVGRLTPAGELKLTVYNLTTGIFSENSNSSGSVTSHENNLRLFNNGPSASPGVPGYYLWLSVWDRSISDGDVEDIRSDPFAMLRPAGF